MSDHFLQVVSDEGEAPRLRLICTAPPDSLCRKRPTGDRETWNLDDPDLEAGHECCAVEWSEADWENLQTEEDGVLAYIPVNVEYVYDEGPSLTVVDGPTDAEVQAAAKAMDGYDCAAAGIICDWDDLPEENRQLCLGSARAALVAAREVAGRRTASNPPSPPPSGSETTMSDEYMPTMDEIKMWYSGAVGEYRCDTGMSEEEGEAAFDRAVAAHDRALRQEIKQQMVERAYFHIAWEKGLTIVPTGPDRAKVPPHWVEAATARVAPYLDIIRGEGPA